MPLPETLRVILISIAVTAELLAIAGAFWLGYRSGFSRGLHGARLPWQETDNSDSVDA
jgi:hypothetical protein